MAKWKRKQGGQIRIECPNTIFHLFVTNEDEITKIEIFMNNIRTMKNLNLIDIYNWCNRQGIEYDTQFNYHKELSTWKNLKSFWNYYKQKQKYLLRWETA